MVAWLGRLWYRLRGSGGVVTVGDNWISLPYGVRLEDKRVRHDPTPNTAEARALQHLIVRG